MSYPEGPSYSRCDCGASRFEDGEWRYWEAEAEEPVTSLPHCPVCCDDLTLTPRQLEALDHEEG